MNEKSWWEINKISANQSCNLYYPTPLRLQGMKDGSTDTALLKIYIYIKTEVIKKIEMTQLDG